MLNHSVQSMLNDDTVSQTLFVGTVVNNVDPLGINRVQVTIPGRLDAGTELPWMAPMRVSPFGQGAGFGVYGAPQIGSQVLIEAQDGHLDHAFYVSGYYGVSNANAQFASPDVWGFQDPSGTFLIVNLVTKTWTFHHVSGLQYSYDASGNYVMQTPGGSTQNFTGGWDLTVGGNVNINTQGSANITAASAKIQASNTEVTGDLHVGGRIVGSGGISVSGGTGANVIQGDLDHTGGTITSNGVSVSGHEHDTPNGRSSPPVVGT